MQSYRDQSLLDSDQKTNEMIKKFEEKFGKKPMVTVSVYHVNDVDLDYNSAIKSQTRGLLESQMSDLKYRGVSTTEDKPSIHLSFLTHGAESNWKEMNEKVKAWAEKHGLDVRFVAEYLSGHGNPGGIIVDDDDAPNNDDKWINKDDAEDFRRIGELFGKADEIYLCSQGCKTGQGFLASAIGEINTGVLKSEGDAIIRAESPFHLGFGSDNTYTDLPQFRILDSGLLAVSHASRNLYPKGGNVMIRFRTIDSSD